MLSCSLEPEWAAAASEVKEQTKGKVKLAAVDATANQLLTSRYGVSMFQNQDNSFCKMQLKTLKLQTPWFLFFCYLHCILCVHATLSSFYKLFLDF